MRRNVQRINRRAGRSDARCCEKEAGTLQLATVGLGGNAGSARASSRSGTGSWQTSTLRSLQMGEYDRMPRRGATRQAVLARISLGASPGGWTKEQGRLFRH